MSKGGKMKKKAAPKKAAKPKAAKSAATSEKVLVLRTCKADMTMTAYGGFRWPESGPVEAPAEWWGEKGSKPRDLKLGWDKSATCGGGFHGWLWGHGDWSNRVQDDDAKWLVVEVDASAIVDLGGKVKFPSGLVLATFGHWCDAMAFIRARRPVDLKADTVATGDFGHASATGYSGHASATGHYGHASATGYYGHASATGHYGHASATGYSGHASATGYSGHASATGNSGHASATGDSGHASATGNSGHASATGDFGHASATGDSGHASATGNSGHASATGYYGWAVAGYSGRAKAGKDGALTVLWHDGSRYRVVTGYVGEDGIEADTWYVADAAGKLVKAA